MGNLFLKDKIGMVLVAVSVCFFTSCAWCRYFPFSKMSRSASLLNQVQSIQLLDSALERRPQPLEKESRDGVTLDRSLMLDQNSTAVLQVKALSGNSEAWIRLGIACLSVGKNKLAFKLYSVANELGHPEALLRIKQLRQSLR